MKKILLTGSSGFVGTNLSEAFKDDFTLFGLDVFNNGKIDKDSFLTWDELELLPEVDVIIHLAGKAHDTSSKALEKEYFDVNVGLTKQIYDHFLKSSAQKFIFFSSVKAAADTVKGDQLYEDDEPNPLTPYGKSKLEAESYIQSYPLPKNKEVYILRPAMIHGPGNKGNLNLLYNLVKKGIPWPLGAFNNKRSFASIDNVVFILKELLSKNIPSGIYQIADDLPISTNELIQLMSEVLGKKTRIWNIPTSVIHSISALGDWLHLPLNSERLKKLTETYIVSNMKIKKVLTVDSLPTNMREGLIKTLKSF
ncbi:MAG: wcfK [Bacteroidetes bacterium]|nr:MAG: wcfK [Bacteroidota bacterium]